MIGVWIGDQRLPQVFEDVALAKAKLQMIGKKKLRGKLIRFVTEAPVTSPRRGRVHRGQVGPLGGLQLRRVR